MKKPLSYKLSGVDIDKANRLIGAVKGSIKKTHGKAVISKPGSFAALFGLQGKFKSPVLVSSTDGVGTKLLLAQKAGIHHTVGIDLVAMNVNDILCVGAKPLFFLDYIACGKLHDKTFKDVIAGIVEGCRQGQCSLIGGETAEMPDMYKPEEYDLAGFVVGVIEENKIIDGSKIKKGDQVIGFPSSGIHSNGYSLVRKALTPSEQKKWSKELLAPTRIYTKEVMSLIENFSIKGFAHNTGGAWFEKLTRILPKGLCYQIKRGSWPEPKIFSILQNRGRISLREMYRTFNMGIGMIAVVDKKDLKKISAFLKKNKMNHYHIGEVIQHKREKVIL